MTELRSLYEEAETNGISVDNFPFRKLTAISMLDVEDGTCHIALNYAKIKSKAEEKSILVHELGHCMTGSFGNAYTARDVRQQYENAADRWAIERLIPFYELLGALRDGYRDIDELAEYFDVMDGLAEKAVRWYIFGDFCTEQKKA